MKRIAILGSTGSIGTQALDVVAQHPERLEVTALVAGHNVDRLEAQVRRFRPRLAVLFDEASARTLRERVSDLPVRVASGVSGILEAAALDGVDQVVVAMVGAAGIRPVLAAIEAGKQIALANKETLVAAGAVVTRAAEAAGVSILPVDSEHSALWQCLAGAAPDAVRRLILTASGGPFRRLSQEELARVTPAQALRHPNWSMGSKVTIDSATLMNKGLEVIEAHWLFRTPYDAIDVLVHPESIVHSLVEFVDGSILAQMGVPDMRLPIQYALLYPERRGGDVPRLRLEEVGALHFEAPDTVRFPCLRYAYHAGRTGGTLPAVMNAANEVAVSLFLQEKIGFSDIPRVIEDVMSRHQLERQPDLEAILQADAWARETARQVASRL